jgi:hypothetical protein
VITDGVFAAHVGSVGAYGWVNDVLYLEGSVYRTLDFSTQNDLGTLFRRLGESQCAHATGLRFHARADASDRADWRTRGSASSWGCAFVATKLGLQSFTPSQLTALPFLIDVARHGCG